MAWLFGQVWVLCLIAFVAGSLVTWLVFAVPARRAAHRRHAPGAAWPITEPPRPGPPRPGVAQPATQTEPESARTLDSALAVLDSWNDRAAARPSTGAAATGALDLLGVEDPPVPPRPGPPGAEAPGPTPSGPTPPIPTQHGPADSDPPRS